MTFLQRMRNVLLQPEHRHQPDSFSQHTAGMHGERASELDVFPGGFGVDADRFSRQFMHRPPHHRVVPLHIPHPGHPSHPVNPATAARNAGLHGELTITHGEDGRVTMVHQPHGDAGDIGCDEPNFNGEINETLGHFGFDLPGDDPIGDGNLDDPTEDLGLPTANPWGVAAADVVDSDWDPIAQSGRTGSITNHRFYDDIRPTFGFEDDYYAGFGPAVVMGCERFG